MSMSRIPAEGRCEFYFADGRRCTMPKMKDHRANLCFDHWNRLHYESGDLREFSKEIMDACMGRLDSPEAINAAVTRLIAMLIVGNIPPRHAGLVIYAVQQLLTSVAMMQRSRRDTAIERELAALRREVAQLAASGAVRRRPAAAGKPTRSHHGRNGSQPALSGVEGSEAEGSGVEGSEVQGSEAEGSASLELVAVVPASGNGNGNSPSSDATPEDDPDGTP